MYILGMVVAGVIGIRFKNNATTKMYIYIRDMVSQSQTFRSERRDVWLRTSSACLNAKPNNDINAMTKFD